MADLDCGTPRTGSTLLDNGEVHAKLGATLRMLDEKLAQRALALLEKALALNPRACGSLSQSRCALQTMDQRERAVVHLKKAAALKVNAGAARRSQPRGPAAAMHHTDAAR